MDLGVLRFAFFTSLCRVSAWVWALLPRLGHLWLNRIFQAARQTTGYPGKGPFVQKMETKGLQFWSTKPLFEIGTAVAGAPRLGTFPTGRVCNLLWEKRSVTTQRGMRPER